MKKLPLFLFLVAILFASFFLYRSWQEKRGNTMIPAQSPRLATQRAQVLRTKSALSERLAHLQPQAPAHAKDSAEVQQLKQQIAALDAELEQMKNDTSHEGSQDATPTISNQDRVIASAIFGMLAGFIIMAKRFPEDQKKYGFLILMAIVGFWLKA